MTAESWMKVIMVWAVFMIWKELHKANRRDRRDD